MKILHTADWHIGQLFYNYDRFYEHEQFLHWLVDILAPDQIELLLICGDVFDNANFDLQTIVIEGNQNAASKLETFMPLWECDTSIIDEVILKSLREPVIIRK